MSNDIISTKIYDKRDDFDADIINFRFGMAMFLLVRPFWDGDVPLSTSYFSIRFARASSQVSDIDHRIYWNYHNLDKTFIQKLMSNIAFIW